MILRLVIGVLKTIVVITTFAVGVCSIVLTQCVGKLLSLLIFQRVQTEFTYAWIARTKSLFIVLLSAILSFISQSPIRIRITSPNLDKSRLKRYTDGSLEMVLSPHALMISNHQIYTDWVFLWWLTHTAELSGFIYIFLKDELSRIPILGFGMKSYQFIFLTRKWVVDKVIMARHLDAVDANARGKGPASIVVSDEVKNNQDPVHSLYPKGTDPTKAWPYQMLIFPEGTNLSLNTREKTEAFAKKVDRKPFKHVLLPRTTGLRFTLLKLQNTLEEVYDITIGYSGVKPDEYGQDIYRLPQVFLYGKNPELVDMHIRVLKLNEIPIGKLEYDDPEEEQRDVKKFEDWLFDVWQKKDDLLDLYYKTGSFTSIEAEKYTVKATTTLSASFTQFVQIFILPLTLLIFARIGYIVYSIWFNPAATCAAPLASPEPTFVNVFE